MRRLLAVCLVLCAATADAHEGHEPASECRVTLGGVEYRIHFEKIIPPIEPDEPLPPVDPEEPDDGHDHDPPGDFEPGADLGHGFIVPDDPHALILCDGDPTPTGPLTVSTIMVCGGTHDLSGVDITFLPWEPNREKDPHQWWGGIIVVGGKLIAKGEPRFCWMRATGGLKAGQETIPLRSQTDWKVGEEVCIGGTQQSEADTTEYRVIRAISEDRKAITVDALEHDHPAAVDPKLGTVYTPGVGLITRSMTWRSEDPDRPAHMAVTMNGKTDIEYVEFKDMGRTRGATLHSTILNPDGSVKQFGTNQVGKYGWHAHHALYPQRLHGCSFRGLRKWGPTLHGSSFSSITDCVICDGDGSGIALEERSEYQNEIVGNFICGIRRGTGIGASADHDGGSAVHKEPDTKAGLRSDSSGAFGDAIWCRGVGSNIRNNVGQGCAGWGLNINGYYSWANQKTISYPPAPGEPRSIIAAHCPPGSVHGNEFGGCRGALWLTWSRVGVEGPHSDYATYRNTVGWHNTMYGVEAYHEGATEIDGLLLIFDREVANSHQGTKGNLDSNNNRMNVGMMLSRYLVGRPRFNDIRIYGPTVGIVLNTFHLGGGDDVPTNIETYGKSVISGEIESRLGVYFPSGNNGRPTLPGEWNFSGLLWRHNGESRLKDANLVLAEPRAAYVTATGEFFDLPRKESDE